MLQQLEKSKALLHLDEERIASTSQITGISDLCFGFEPPPSLLGHQRNPWEISNTMGKLEGLGYLVRGRKKGRLQRTGADRDPLKNGWIQI
ncbi:hypothetical protein Droror1_Dr00014304 [Drosera rotundifolia]